MTTYHHFGGRSIRARLILVGVAGSGAEATTQDCLFSALFLSKDLATKMLMLALC